LPLICCGGATTANCMLAEACTWHMEHGAILHICEAVCATHATPPQNRLRTPRRSDQKQCPLCIVSAHAVRQTFCQLLNRCQIVLTLQSHTARAGGTGTIHSGHQHLLHFPWISLAFFPGFSGTAVLATVAQANPFELLIFQNQPFYIYCKPTCSCRCQLQLRNSSTQSLRFSETPKLLDLACCVAVSINLGQSGLRLHWYAMLSNAVVTRLPRFCLLLLAGLRQMGQEL